MTFSRSLYVSSGEININIKMDKTLTKSTKRRESAKILVKMIQNTTSEILTD